MNKKSIIIILLAFVAMAGASNAFDFGIDDEDVAIAVNKDIAGNDIPDEETAVGEATLAVRFLETEGSHVGVNHNLCGGGGVGYANLTENGLHGAAICSAMRCSRSKGVTCAWPIPGCASCSWQSRRSSSATAAIRLFSASSAPSLPCETDLRMS